jgi:hypothetical protein
MIFIGKKIWKEDNLKIIEKYAMFEILSNFRRQSLNFYYEFVRIKNYIINFFNIIY